MLEARLAALGPAERRRLYKRALKLRKEMSRSTAAHRAAMGKKGRRSPRGEWDDAPAFERSRNRPTESLDDCVLRLLLEEHGGSAVESSAEDTPTLRTGTVVAIASGTCAIHAEGRRITCILPPDIATAQLNAGEALGIAMVPTPSYPT